MLSSSPLAGLCSTETFDGFVGGATEDADEPRKLAAIGLSPEAGTGSLFVGFGVRGLLVGLLDGGAP